MAKDPRETDPPRLVDAQIRSDQGLFRHCDVRDLDMHGVFVLGTDGTLSRLPKNAPVEVNLMLHTSGHTRTHRLRARVEGKSREGTSLVFTDADIDTYSALLHLNLDAAPPTKRG
jgi:hypothetical protein